MKSLVCLLASFFMSPVMAQEGVSSLPSSEKIVNVLKKLTLVGKVADIVEYCIEENEKAPKIILCLEEPAEGFDGQD